MAVGGTVMAVQRGVLHMQVGRKPVARAQQLQQLLCRRAAQAIVRNLQTSKIASLPWQDRLGPSQSPPHMCRKQVPEAGVSLMLLFRQSARDLRPCIIQHQLFQFLCKPLFSRLIQRPAEHPIVETLGNVGRSGCRHTSAGGLACYAETVLQTSDLRKAFRARSCCRLPCLAMPRGQS